MSISKISILILTTMFCIELNAQVVVTTTNYFQDFGTSAITGWTDNTTFVGWYNEGGGFQGEEDITTGSPSNAGGLYAYTCNGNNDRKIGLRPSNGSGGGPCNTTKSCGHAYGLRFLNNTGAQITSIEVSYDAFQLSEVQDGGNTNYIYFDYRIGTNLNSVNLGQAGWTSVAALDYEAPVVNGTCGGNQVAGLPCNTSEYLTACIPLTVDDGQEVMLRWLDNNNSCNDPHLALDNVNVFFYIDGTTCNSALPIDIRDFTARRVQQNVNINWLTFNESNSDFFTVERSIDGEHFSPIGYVNASGNSNKIQKYSLEDTEPINNQMSYYRLIQTDNDGYRTTSKIISVKPIENTEPIGYFNSLGQKVDPETSGIVIIRYNDGSIERRYNP